MKKSWLMSLMVVGIVLFDGYLIWKYVGSNPTAGEFAQADYEYDEEEEQDFDLDEGLVAYSPELADASDTHKLLRMIYDIPGVDDPELVDVAESELPGATPIVGVEVGGESYAFSLQAMDQPAFHVVNLLAGTQPITVTYCPLIDCVRVFSSEDDETIPMRLGGLNEEDEMVLLLNGTRYDQRSTKLPLSDYGFQRSTLGQWKKSHPRTKVFQRKPARPSSRQANVR